MNIFPYVYMYLFLYVCNRHVHLHTMFTHVYNVYIIHAIYIIHVLCSSLSFFSCIYWVIFIGFFFFALFLRFTLQLNSVATNCNHFQVGLRLKFWYQHSSDRYNGYQNSAPSHLGNKVRIFSFVWKMVASCSVKQCCVKV
jgi:hypothetical protein